MKDNWDSNKYSTIASLQAQVSKKLIEQLNLKENDRVLDIGCGIGNLTFKVAEIVKKGHVVGIDSSSSMIKKCNESLKTQNISNINFIQKGITELDFLNEFDVIYSNSVFHWVKEPKRAIDLMYKSLKQGGTLSLKEEFENWEFPWFVPTLHEFKNLFEQYNLEKIKVYTKNIKHKNINSSKLYNSFDSAGLNMFTSILSLHKEKIFKAEFKKEIENMTVSNQSTINFERLYAFGYKII